MVTPPLTQATRSSALTGRDVAMTSHNADKLLRVFFNTSKVPAGSLENSSPINLISAQGTSMTTPISGDSFRIAVAISIELSSVLCISKSKTSGCMLRKRFIAALFLRASPTTLTPWSLSAAPTLDSSKGSSMITKTRSLIR